MNFIKKIFTGIIDQDVHKQFIRFGNGSYKNKAVIKATKTKEKLKLDMSFEFVNDILNFIAENKGINFSGIIFSKENIDEELGTRGESKKGLFVYETEISPEKIKEIMDKAYFMLLDCDTKSIRLRTKKRLPKPGKGEAKTDNKFCQLELTEKEMIEKATRDFLFDVEEFKKARISHDFVIDEIILPLEEKDFAIIRQKAKRKGKIIRKIAVDSKEMQEEKEFEA